MSIDIRGITFTSQSALDALIMHSVLQFPTCGILDLLMIKYAIALLHSNDILFALR